MTYKEIEKKYDIKYHDLTDRVGALGIKGKFKSKILHFSKAQVQEILTFAPKKKIKKMSRENHVRKLKIIEFYLKLGSARKTADFLNIGWRIIYPAVREYNETGCVTVESKLNHL